MPDARPCVVRLDSPGRAADLYAAIVARGLPHAQREGGPSVRDFALTVELQRSGAIVCPRQWYLGYADLLRTLDPQLDRFSWRTVVTADVLLFFDKLACSHRLRRGGIPVPASLGAIANYDELRAAMRRASCSRVFLKLAHGSAASGVMAYQRRGADERAWTTTEIGASPAGTQLFNSRRVRPLRDTRRVAAVVDALAPHGLYVERWIPKAGLGGMTFDLRVLVVAGVPSQIVVRRARGPITNLHLGSQRATVHELRRAMPSDSWASLMQTCRATAALFPRTLQIGLDIAITPGLRSHRVLEVNAFGDLLHGITHDGKSSYQSQIDAVRQVVSSGNTQQHEGWSVAI